MPFTPACNQGTAVPSRAQVALRDPPAPIWDTLLTLCVLPDQPRGLWWVKVASF